MIFDGIKMQMPPIFPNQTPPSCFIFLRVLLITTLRVVVKRMNFITNSSINHYDWMSKPKNMDTILKNLDARQIFYIINLYALRINLFINLSNVTKHTKYLRDLNFGPLQNPRPIHAAYD